MAFCLFICLSLSVSVFLNRSFCCSLSSSAYVCLFLFLSSSDLESVCLCPHATDAVNTLVICVLSCAMCDLVFPFVIVIVSVTVLVWVAYLTLGSIKKN